MSATVSIRSFVGAETVSGTAYRRESFVSVRWGFAAVPVFAVVAAGYSYCLRGGKTGLFGAVGGWVFTVEEVYQMEEESRGGYKAE